MFFTATQQTPARRPAYFNPASYATAPQGYTVAQDEAAFTLQVDVPGIQKEQLGISIEGTSVQIASKEGAGRSYKLAYEFPQDIDPNASQAKLENGVLTLKLAKILPKSQAVELTVH